jgi:hypothetical protein
MKSFLILDSKDNVATAITNLETGFELEDVFLPYPVTCVENIKRGHKVALTDINEGDVVVKYGVTIGRAIAPIKKGELVHVHNLRSQRGKNKNG